jgi:Arc/MetJ-type ribon-helix-helix transcriptional regulator
MAREPEKHLVTLRIPIPLVERIDAWAARDGSGLSRSDAIRMLVTKALDADDDGKTVKLTGDQADRLDKAMRRLRAKDTSETIDQILELLDDEAEAPAKKPGIVERVGKGLKSLVGDQPARVSPAMARAAKRS